MHTTCLNCNAALHGKFCHTCGQEARHAKISWSFLWRDIQQTIIQFDKGFFYTCKELLTQPSLAIKSYLSGKRVKHFKPISFVLVLAGTYGFLSHYFNLTVSSIVLEAKSNNIQTDDSLVFIKQLAKWMNEHYTWIILLQIPLFAFATRLVFRKVGYNFVEHFIANSYLTGQRLLINTLALPLYFFISNASALKIALRLVDGLAFVFLFWSLYHLFDKVSKTKRILRIFASLLLSAVLTVVFLFLISELNHK